MAKSFEVQIQKFPFTEEDLSTLATAIDTWLDSLNIGSDHTVYEIDVQYKSGFIIVTAIYEP